MTLRRFTTLTLCATLGSLTLACDLGDKSLGDQPGDGDGDPGDGDGDGDGDPGACAPMDAGQTGDLCYMPDGWFWNGSGCEQILCGCVGSECDSLFADEQACLAAYAECPIEDPAPTGDCGAETVTIVKDPMAALPGFDLVVADYLAMIEGSFAGDMQWLANDGPITVAHAGTDSPLTATVVYAGDAINLTEVALVGQSPDNGLDIAELCSNVLEIPVFIEFATQDGLFAESWKVPVTVLSHDGVSLPGYYFTIDFDAHAGALAPKDFSVDQGGLSNIYMVGQFPGDALDGSVMMEVETMGWVGFGPAANYTAARQP